MSKGISKFFLIVVVIVVAFLAYRFFFVSSGETQVGLVSLAPAGISSGSDQFVTLLSSLRAINLDDLPRVLTLLNSLEDFSTVLEPQTPGRSNPFLPIGRSGGPVASSTLTNATTTTTSTSTATTTRTNP